LLQDLLDSPQGVFRFSLGIVVEPLGEPPQFSTPINVGVSILAVFTLFSRTFGPGSLIIITVTVQTGKIHHRYPVPCRRLLAQCDTGAAPPLGVYVPGETVLAADDGVFDLVLSGIEVIIKQWEGVRRRGFDLLQWFQYPNDLGSPGRELEPFLACGSITEASPSPTSMRGYDVITGIVYITGIPA